MDKDVVYIVHIYTIHTHTHIHTTEYSSAIKNNEILPFAATWMDLESIVLSEKVRQRKTLCDFTYMWNLKKINKLVNKKGAYTDVEHKLRVTSRERGKNQNSGVGKKLLWNYMKSCV